MDAGAAVAGRAVDGHGRRPRADFSRSSSVDPCLGGTAAISHRGLTTEPSFNEALGAALRQSVARWRESPDCVQVERTRTIAGAPGKHPDVLIADPQMWPVAIEASFDGRDADKDASARLGLETATDGMPIETAVSVRIPDSCRQWPRERIAQGLAEGEELAYAVHQRTGEGTSRRWPKRGFVTGSARDLVDLLPLVALPPEVVQETADYVAQRVQWAAARLHRISSSWQRKELAAEVHQRTALTGLATTMVLWLNALLTQARIHERHKRLPAPADCCDEEGCPLPSRFVRAWREILSENWRSVFEPAKNVMARTAASNVGATSQALRCLLEAVERIESRRLGIHINVGAELFPKLSDDRKTAAAYYTQPPAAEFLAAMTVTRESLPSGASWADPNLWDRAKIADLACGTGTLLRAGYRRIAALHQRSGGATPSSLVQLHKAAMETGIYGADISPIAAHLTASSLAALGDGNPYGATHVGWVRVGGAPAKAGALEYFEADEMDDLFGTAGERSAGVEEERPSSVHVGDDSLGWALMNPPYSRTRGGQSAFDVAGVSEEERKACQRRWRDLTRGKSNNQAGMAASFLALADQKLRSGGRLGFVLPLTAAFADSWTMTRRLVETKYSDVAAIAFSAGRALGRDAVSADTGMEEMMLVATKRAPAGGSAVVRCVTLYEPLRDGGQAHEIARAVGRALEQMGAGHFPVRVGDEEIGRVVAFHADGSGKPWTPVAVQSALLPEFSSALSRGRFGELAGPRSVATRVAFGRLEDLFEIGPTHDLIGYPLGGDGRGAFEFHPLPPGASLVGDRALWVADSKKQQRLEVRPTHKGIVPKALAGRDQDRMRARAGTLFYARNLRWTSQSLLAATTEMPVMGGRSWTALRHDDERVLKAFALWANSTLGSLLHWSVGQRTHAGRSTTQIGALRGIPVPLLDRLDARPLDGAAREFDAIKTKLLRPLCQAHADPVREEIDQAVARMLALPPWAGEVAANLRDLWCREPSVHGNNKAALAALRRRDDGVSGAAAR